MGYEGFVEFQGVAYFRPQSAAELLANRVHFPGATLHVAASGAAAAGASPGGWQLALRFAELCIGGSAAAAPQPAAPPAAPRARDPKHAWQAAVGRTARAEAADPPPVTWQWALRHVPPQWPPPGPEVTPAFAPGGGEAWQRAMRIFEENVGSQGHLADAASDDSSAAGPSAEEVAREARRIAGERLRGEQEAAGEPVEHRRRIAAAATELAARRLRGEEPDGTVSLHSTAPSSATPSSAAASTAAASTAAASTAAAAGRSHCSPGGALLRAARGAAAAAARARQLGSARAQ
eukprot:TRINITY_DN15070_c0_g1_i1.p1 TRINITY_DN15070_c0_g1~~TRINITY_DN15070_c0_g1_i1.p1  ORF type:complete len:292 (+),score=84.30 TRINITY_DN15070_c0_g1_i1:244-1119(+)